MSLKSRLGKLERRCSTDILDLFKLSDDALQEQLRKFSDDELLEQMRKCIVQLGIDWGSFQNDPTGAVEKAFEGVEDDEGLIAGFLKAIAEADIDWLTGEPLPPVGW